VTIRRYPALLGALAALATAFTANGCSRDPSQTNQANPSSAVAPPRQYVTLGEAAATQAGIVVEIVAQDTRAVRIKAPGIVALDETRTARIGSLQEGLILETRAQVGDRLRSRQVLAVMHSHDVHDAWAGYRKAMAERRRLEKELSFAVEAHARATRLYADKAVSLQEVQRAEVDRVAAAEMVDMAAAEVRRSVEELEHLGIALSGSDTVSTTAPQGSEQISIRTPIAGVVLERLVTPGTTVMPSAPLFVVSDLSTLWVIAEIDEAQLPRVRQGRPVEVTVGAYPDERFTGTVSFVADTVNPTTRRITVRSTVPNGNGRLKPEMFATVWLGESDPRPVLVVPQSAVQTIDGKPSVFVALPERRYAPQPVELGSNEGGRVEVLSGLSAGQRIVVAGSFALKSEWLSPAGAGER
jgi:cobalt-zinc-cadmium efflux system membrane fusion protein